MEEKWSEQRINAQKRYIKTDETLLNAWEYDLKVHEEAVIRAKRMIESKRQSIAEQTKELAEQQK